METKEPIHIPLIGEKRIRHGVEVVLMAQAEGYVMYLSKACYPGLMPLRNWNELPKIKDTK